MMRAPPPRAAAPLPAMSPASAATITTPGGVAAPHDTVGGPVPNGGSAGKAPVREAHPRQVTFSYLDHTTGKMMPMQRAPPPQAAAAATAEIAAAAEVAHEPQSDHVSAQHHEGGAPRRAAYDYLNYSTGRLVRKGDQI
eukprot:6033705-Prymnesium_polylepis.1